MRAIVIPSPGGPEVLRLEERPLPEPSVGQVRVKVLFAGLNRADLLQRRGQYPAPPDAPPDVPGMEISGIVDATGPGVTLWNPGQRVFGLLGGGGYAEYVLTHERLLAAVPHNLTDEAAGAVPEVFITAHDALFTQADMRPGESVLIHAAGSGVATAAIQLVKAVGGTSYGTARSPEKLGRAKQLGLDYALPLPDFVTALKDLTNNRGVDIGLDFVGAPYLDSNLRALALRGRLVQIGTMGGQEATLDLGLLMRQRLQITGTVLRSRPLEEKALATRRFEKEVCPLLQKGTVKPIVDRIYSLEHAAEAHAYMEQNNNFGKILLQI